uniref:DUF834 domain-containing protein n=1 Tax=Oryza brachyantha TaxID=4533 RepID=J3NAD7_ORYBR
MERSTVTPLDWQCLVGADGGDRVAGDVEAVAAPVVAEDVVEGDDDSGVAAGVAGLPERALLLVAAPVDGEAGVVGRRRRRRGEEQQPRQRQEESLHHEAHAATLPVRT